MQNGATVKGTVTILKCLVPLKLVHVFLCRHQAHVVNQTNLFLLSGDRRTPARSPPIAFPIANTLSLRNSSASIMGLYSPYLGDLNGFSSLNPSSSLMTFLLSGSYTVHCWYTQACHGKTFPSAGRCMKRICTLNYLTCLFLLPCFISLFCLFCLSLSCCIYDSLSYTLRSTLNSYLLHVYTNSSAAAAFTYSNVFSLAVVLNNMCVFTFCTLQQISPHTVTHHTLLSPAFHPTMWKLKQSMDLH